MPRTAAPRLPYAGSLVGLYVRASDDRKKMAKSVRTQTKIGQEWASDQGAIVHRVYKDNDLSASRYATKERDDFEALCNDIENGPLQIVWFFTLSRSQRELGTFARLRNLSRRHNVLWVVENRVYDLNDRGDRLALGFQALQDEELPEQISLNTRKAAADAAQAGLPPGRPLYGYDRIYHPRTKVLTEVVFNEEQASIVREVAARFLRGESLNGIVGDLTRRGAPTGGSGSWSISRLTSMLRQPGYIAKRKFHGRVVADAIWPPILDEEDFYTIQTILATRKTERPSRIQHLLTGTATAAPPCGGKLRTRLNSADRMVYTCRIDGCVTLREDWVDAYVEDYVLSYLEQPGTLDGLRALDLNPGANEARAEAARLRAELDEWVQAAKNGLVKALRFGEIERALEARIAEAERRVGSGRVPAVVLDAARPDIRTLWADEVEYPLLRRREVVRSFVSVRVHPPGMGKWRSFNPDWVEVTRNFL